MPPSEGAEMTRLIRCECGHIARGDTDDAVIDAIQVHITTDHPDLVGKISRDAMASWIQLDD
jgi:hypothetical protein